jgi:hypothetical protein
VVFFFAFAFSSPQRLRCSTCGARLCVLARLRARAAGALVSMKQRRSDSSGNWHIFQHGTPSKQDSSNGQVAAGTLRNRRRICACTYRRAPARCASAACALATRTATNLCTSLWCRLKTCCGCALLLLSCAWRGGILSADVLLFGQTSLLVPVLRLQAVFGYPGGRQRRLLSRCCAKANILLYSTRWDSTYLFGLWR